MKITGNGIEAETSDGSVNETSMTARGAQTKAKSAKDIEMTTAGATVTKIGHGVRKTRTARNGALATTATREDGMGGMHGPRRSIGT